VKSNLGHTQAAAGVAGVIKMILALRHQQLPRTLHVDTPSSQVDWTTGKVALLSEPVDWPENGHPRRAGISSFGISGTNAHLIIEAPPTAPEAARPEPAELGVLPVVVSGRSPAALRSQAARLGEFLAKRPDVSLAELALAAATSRSAFEYRAAALVRDRAELVDSLAELAQGREGSGLVEGRVVDGELAFVFSGQGGQRSGMGLELVARFPVFARAWHEVATELDILLDRPLSELVAGDLAMTGDAQPALFALQVASYRLVESWGVRPGALIGHSVGEIAAAHVAGVLSLSDACRLVAARARLMQALPAGGAMVAVAAPEDQVAPLLVGHEDAVSIAAVNGPASVVLSGVEAVVGELADRFVEQGVRTRRLNVSHAFHSPLMAPMLAEFAAVLSELSFTPPSLDIVSTVEIGADLATADYWIRHISASVRFADALNAAAANGVANYLELGPDGVASAMTQDVLVDAVAIPLLRADRDEPAAAIEALARLHVHGVPVRWSGFFPTTGVGRIELPTYAFQRDRYWPDGAGASVGNVAAAGLVAADHPLLGATVRLAGSDGALLTARLSVSAHPWLGDHVVGGSIVFPGTGFLELAIRAGDQVGCDRVEELTLAAPLVFTEDSAVAVQVAVAQPDESGRRTVDVYARPAEARTDQPWVRHATGTLTTGPTEDEADTEPFDGAQWPPEDTEAVDLTGSYERLADGGLRYGPVFQGLRAAWRRDGAVFVEVALPEQVGDAGRFGLHPALLDAALHAVPFVGMSKVQGTGGRMPFTWSGVALQATGASALRVRLVRTGEDAVSVTAVDLTGNPVFSARALLLRQVPVEQLTAARDSAQRDARQDSLFRLDWIAQPPVMSPVDAVAGLDVVELTGELDTLDLSTGPVPDLVVVTAEPETDEDADLDIDDMDIVDDEPAGDAVVDRVHKAIGRLLRLVQQWLAEDRLAESRMVVVTEHAIAARPDDDTVDLAAAAVWGLIRSAQAEHPGRFLLVDIDEYETSRSAIPGVLACAEPQAVVRDHVVLVSRLARLTPAAESAPEPTSWASDGAVLITGGTGGLGGLMARHLVADLGVRSLVLTSRRGLDAPDAVTMRDELAELGAEVTVAACDVSDREEVAALLAAHPITAVVHTAGVLDDGVITALNADRLDAVLSPKVDGAWHLHELTADRDLTAFVVFSSVAGTMGAPGQGNYAAANAFLDGLAQHRRLLGLPAASIAWGPWDQGAGMTSGLGEADLQRLARAGITALTPATGVELFDAALRADTAVAAAVQLDLSALATAPDAAVMLRGLLAGIPTARPVVARSTVDERGALRERLLALRPAARLDHLLRLVADQTARVLGHRSAAPVEPGSRFSDLGFDSLTAVELRNGLNMRTGLRLSSTLIFDYPTVAALAEHLRTELVPADAATETRSLLADLEQFETALAEQTLDELTRSGLATRLSQLLAKVNKGAKQAEGGETAGVDLFESASTAELMAFIDNELGRRPGQ
jgi:acyl transferase domain-containing protein/acyl carrier protein